MVPSSRATREILIHRFLSSSKLRATAERRAIVGEIVTRGGKHFSAEDLVDKFRRRGTRVSRATVYRTLEHLVAAGIVRRLILGHKQALYERSDEPDHHGHLICLRCGKVAEFASEPLQRLLDTVGRKHRFETLSGSLQVFGMCRRCASEERS